MKNDGLKIVLGILLPTLAASDGRGQDVGPGSAVPPVPASGPVQPASGSDPLTQIEADHAAVISAQQNVKSSCQSRQDQSQGCQTALAALKAAQQTLKSDVTANLQGIQQYCASIKPQGGAQNQTLSADQQACRAIVRKGRRSHRSRGNAGGNPGQGSSAGASQAQTGQ